MSWLLIISERGLPAEVLFLVRISLYFISSIKMLYLINNKDLKCNEKALVII